MQKKEEKLKNLIGFASYFAYFSLHPSAGLLGGFGQFHPGHHCWVTRYIAYLRGCQNSSKSIVIYLICSNYIYCKDKERKEGALGDKFASFSNHSSEGKLTQFDLALAKAHSLSGVSGCKIFDFLQHRCNSFL